MTTTVTTGTHGSHSTHSTHGSHSTHGDLSGLDALRAAARAAWRSGRDVEVGDHVPVPDSRDGRMELQRRRDVFDREAEAMDAHVPLEAGQAPRVVIARRQEWTGQRLAAELSAAGYVVAAVVVDGADAVGVCVAEQPDVLLVEDVLLRMTGAEVLRAVSELCPGTHCVAQIGGTAQRDAFLAAGAHDTHLRNEAPSLGVPLPRR